MLWTFTVLDFLYVLALVHPLLFSLTHSKWWWWWMFDWLILHCPYDDDDHDHECLIDWYQPKCSSSAFSELPSSNKAMDSVDDDDEFHDDAYDGGDDGDDDADDINDGDDDDADPSQLLDYLIS